jgi:hypothetical protein
LAKLVGKLVGIGKPFGKKHFVLMNHLENHLVKKLGAESSLGKIGT